MNRRRRTSPKPPLPFILGGASVLVLVVVGGYLWLSSASDDPPGDEGPDHSQGAEADPLIQDFEAPWSWGAGPGREVEPLDFPEPSARDAFLRNLLQGLSDHPRWAAWLLPDDLVHRFVRAVVALAAGASPGEPLDFMVPDEPFAPATAMDRLVIPPEAYARYNTPVELLASMDPEQLANLYHQLLPLLQDAHRELGFPSGTFDQTFSLALQELLRVNVPAGALAVVPAEEGVVYTFADPRYENLTPAAKHLMRMGPRNARTLQDQIRRTGQAIWGSAAPR